MKNISTKAKQACLVSIFTSCCIGFVSAYGGYISQAEFNYIGNFLLFLTVGFVFTLVLLFVMTLKERILKKLSCAENDKKRIFTKIVANSIIFLSISLVGFIWSKILYVSGEYSDFLSATQYWSVIFIILLLVLLGTLLFDVLERRNSKKYPS